MVGMLYFAQTIFKRLGMAILLFLLVSAGYGVDSVDAGNVDKLKKESENIDAKIKQNKAKLRTYQKKETDLLQNLRQTDRLLNRTQNEVAAYQKQIDKLESQLKEMTDDCHRLEKQIALGESYAASRIVALYKLTRTGALHILASAESSNDFLWRKKALERVLDHDEKNLRMLGENRSRLEKKIHDLNLSKKEKALLEKKCKQKIRTISEKKVERETLLSKIRKEKSYTETRLKNLKQAAKELDQKISMLSAQQKSEKTVVKVTGKGFVSLKGLLNMPVEGKIISFYGAYKNKELNVQNFQSGIDIQAERGKPVRAVYEGRVLFSDWFKGYGNLMIIDHGNNYYTVYAHMDKVYKKNGDRVKTGEVIATVGDTGSLTGPKLHFEVRHHGKSMNPVEWIKKG